MKDRGTTSPIPRNSPPASLAARAARNRAHLPRYSSRIIKAGALLTDTKSLLLAWDLNSTVPQNLDRIRRENPFGKASRSRVEDILAIFRQRYLADPAITRSLLALLDRRLSSLALARIFYFHAASADPLLHDTVTEILFPRWESGRTDIAVSDLQPQLSRWVRERRTVGEWSPATVNRIAQGLLATLRDFGLLHGKSRKQIAPPFVPIEAFAWVAFLLNQQLTAGSRLPDHPSWKLFFLSREAVERFLFEAHQRHLLEYHVAGSVARLTFPAHTPENYTHVITQK